MASFRFADILSGLAPMQARSNQIAYRDTMRDELSRLSRDRRVEAAELAREQAEIDRLAAEIQMKKRLAGELGGMFGDVAGSSLAGYRSWDAAGRPSFSDAFADLF
jgi:hypothetical protein